jgi:CheY-like chemotaxis protein
MPGMTGFALAEQLKAQRAVPIVLMTGWAEDLDEATTAGVDVVLAKPFTREKLFEAIARAVPDRVKS